MNECLNICSVCFLDPIGEDEEGEGIVLQEQKLPWEGTDRDYIYEEVCNSSYYTLCLKFKSNSYFCLLFLVQLLGRVFHILRENNPELAGDRRRTVMRPPQVLREGTKKTVFVNFMDLCKS